MDAKLVESIHVYSFKRTSVGGDICRYRIRVYVGKENVVYVTKLFLSEEGDAPFKLLKKFKNKWLYAERMAFKEQTLIDITANALQIIHSGFNANITMTPKK